MPDVQHGLVIGKFAPLHRGHQLLIETALSRCASVTVWCYSAPDFPEMPTEQRTGWIRALYPTVRVIAGAPGCPPNDAPDAVHQAYVQSVVQTWPRPVDGIFSSETYGEPLADRLGARHHLVDLHRAAVPVSGTRVREDVHAHRAFLHPLVYAHFVQKVAVLGAESTGKTTLAEALARRYGTGWVHEYGAEVFLERGGQLTTPDFTAIARGHRAREDQAVLGGGPHRFLFSDTNAMTTAMFAFMMTRAAEPELLKLAAECRTRYAHVVVCDDGLPFDSSHWRASENVRAIHQGLILHDLAVRGIPHTLVRGSVAQRVEQVCAVLDAPLPVSLSSPRSA
ncbi:AAA family ATPase [Deinococcus sp. SDU3-2]|uniref:AAA family ATPase n=1 Tax=Deinococcus terrestris TaxID=2651870 RepID=A0A7X1TSC9_9DEIO|nr:AAA family ATPase [Deinococcus terrestris]MPY67708.1 AAA family ATPase [Deinococcus terrestris]